MYLLVSTLNAWKTIRRKKIAIKINLDQHTGLLIIKLCCSHTLTSLYMYNANMGCFFFFLVLNLPCFLSYLSQLFEKCPFILSIATMPRLIQSN